VKINPVRLIFAVIGLGIGVVAVLAMREATLSTHESVDPNSRVALVLDARTEGGERGHSLDEMVVALLARCRLEVTSDLVGPVVHEGNGRFRAVMQPTLDETNRRQYRGCIEDWTIDHLLVDVVAFEPDVEASSSSEAEVPAGAPIRTAAVRSAR
jgi:hypothetical protein